MTIIFSPTEDNAVERVACCSPQRVSHWPPQSALLSRWPGKTDWGCDCVLADPDSVSCLHVLQRCIALLHLSLLSTVVHRVLAFYATVWLCLVLLYLSLCSTVEFSAFIFFSTVLCVVSLCLSDIGRARESTGGPALFFLIVTPI